MDLVRLWVHIEDVARYLPALASTPWTLTADDPEAILLDAHTFQPEPRFGSARLITLARTLTDLEASLKAGAHASVLTPRCPEDLVDELHMLLTLKPESR